MSNTCKPLMRRLASRLGTLPERIAAARVAILTALLMTTLGGCVQLAGDGDARVYFLSPKSSFDRLPAATANWQLVVEEPAPAGGLDTARIAVHPRPFEIRYYRAARWAARAPAMVQTLIVESFENSGRLPGATRPGSAIRPDFRLRVELREFQAEYAASNDADIDDPSQDAAMPTVHVALAAQLVHRDQRRIVGSQRFALRISAESGALPAVVAAFDTALGGVLKELVSWTLACGEHATAAMHADGDEGADGEDDGVTCPA